jgi:hypothetical protein
VDDEPDVGSGCGTLAQTKTFLGDRLLVVLVGDTKSCINVAFALTSCESQNPGDHNEKTEAAEGYQCESIDYSAEITIGIMINDDIRGVGEYKTVDGKLL